MGTRSRAALPLAPRLKLSTISPDGGGQPYGNLALLVFILIGPALKEAGFFCNLIIIIKIIKYNWCYMARYMLTLLVRKSLCRKDLRPRPPRARKSLAINNLAPFFVKLNRKNKNKKSEIK